jgi:TRAP-type C4-dicarboxylate transport system substrate-binding protein
MLRLMQLGVVPFGTALFSQLTAQDPEFSAPDLAGLNPDMRTLRKTVSAFRPHLERALRQQRGIEVLALYAYPAQMIFCNKPLSGLSSIAGLRVRVSGPTSADFIEALGGVPVITAFNDIIGNIQAGAIDCAITGSMSGNAIGLHRFTTYLHSMPVTWGLALFGANSATWEQLDPELKSLLRRELPRLEAAIWDDAERETVGGIACNTGAATCTGGTAGSMVAVNTSAADEELRKEIMRTKVLPRWIQRCGPSCGDLWNKTLASVTGIKAAR